MVLPEVMVEENLSDLMEDNRFKEVRKFKKNELPLTLQNFYGDDYLYEEVLGVYSSEISKYKFISEEGFKIFEKATDMIIAQKALHQLQIPSFFHSVIEKSWRERNRHPFLLGRFDINGGIDEKNARIIEFNADTCSTIPETIVWQKMQLQEIPMSKGQFNNLEKDVEATLLRIKASIPLPQPFFLASSFGHPEDKNNCNVLLNIAHKVCYETFYTDLENVIFSDDGIFFEIGGEYQPVDVWFKMIPWDWMFHEEPELAERLARIIENNLCIVLNPTYTAIWQNKLFLNYITKNFPNTFIAETYDDPFPMFGRDYVEKPVYGRMGENIKIPNKNLETKGDFGNQSKVYQRYYPLDKDQENYYYQPGVFYTTQPSALNFRAENREIISNDCEFVSHYII